MANDYHWRSTKAKQQLRDRFGRWISLGANVRFRDGGQEQAGVVTSVVDGKAYIDQKNLDGTVTKKILTADQLRVIASKATLPPDGKRIQDPNNNFAKAMQTQPYKDAIATGKAVIQRADGFALAANIVDKAQGNDNVVQDGSSDVKDKSTGNPIVYQLFAPGGVSLGTYSQGAEGDFDSMVEDYKANDGQQPDTAPSGDGAAPAADSGPVTASSDVFVSDDKTFRVPDSVKTTIASALELGILTEESDIANAKALAYNDRVSLSEVAWIGNYFESVAPAEQVRGGYEGKKWASKIISPAETEFSLEDGDLPTQHPKYAFDDDTFAYFAIGQTPGSTFVDNLLAVEYESGAVYTWTADGFTLVDGLDMAEVDEPQIIPIDEMTADEFAHWLDSGQPGEYDILDTDAEERNLFTLADSEIDYDELDQAFSIIAAGATDGVYTPVERSQNAKAQARGAGGKFGSTPHAAPAPQEAEPKVKKATLPVELPLVADPAARISEWLSTAAEAPVVAAGDPQDDGSYPAQDQAVEDAATGPTDEALYFAIVDPVDKTAVMDVVAIVKQNGQPSCFIRANGTWTPSPETLQSLQGATPPPVAELTDPETVKTVLQQVDDHDAGNSAPTEDPSADAAPAAAPTQAPAPTAVAASGFAMADGSYTIIDSEDLKNVVSAFGDSADLFVKAHIRKRARALNRMDLVPAAWREFTLAEIGELSAAKTLYGEFGEIIVASGTPGVADTPSDFKNAARLQAYWTHGKGALKIRWGTKGDLTRAHRHLAKYVGPLRAWGLAQKYHKHVFGVYNHTHDVATGQYVPRKRKK